jgi:copper chaperone
MEKLTFKTNIKCEGCIEKVTPGLNETAGAGHWQVDLSKPERILTVESNVDEKQIKEALQKAGYKAERLQNNINA